ncbi:DUF5691 domain-containing protein [Lewinella sp. IMCC34183]|uniref:DUF5691 domain-containing protein n=1 Tax=Lewinella sp. IMCC34183 TaxID=2248762 RepID=UPI000E27C807|nr:DUF5691 domain-containing protein [Lewinella sp. IMCC34183]
MAHLPPFAELLRALTLGTARRSPDPTLLEWLDARGAIDPTADAAEQLLAAVALTERTHRLELRKPSASVPTTALAPPETRVLPAARLARGLQLILGDTYPELLDEAVALVLDRGTYVPPNLLPALLPRAAALLDTDPLRARRYLEAGGERGAWLAGQHPDWITLTDNFSYPAAWRREEQPAHRAAVLTRWRRVASADAREALAAIWTTQAPRNQEILLKALETGISPADAPWLREALGPKRKGVRRQLFQLLLLAGEDQALADWRALAYEVVSGSPGRTLSETGRELLKTYGGVKAPVTARQWLLRIGPPAAWKEVTGLELPVFWSRLPELELRAAGRAIRDGGSPEVCQQFLRFLLLEEPQQFPRAVAAELVRRLPGREFDALYGEVLSSRTDALRLRGIPRFLALQRTVSWNERLSRAMITRLLDDLHSRQLDYATQRDLALHWKQAAPLLDPELFPWLRQQLHATAERPDVFGKLATGLLQTTSFRRQLRQP